jgi:hypothetical protein
VSWPLQKGKIAVQTNGAEIDQSLQRECALCSSILSGWKLFYSIQGKIAINFGEIC